MDQKTLDNMGDLVHEVLWANPFIQNFLTTEAHKELGWTDKESEGYTDQELDQLCMKENDLMDQILSHMIAKPNTSTLVTGKEPEEIYS